MVSKITDIAPFVGYAQNEDQTEKKRLRNVLKKGDLYFNSGDLMRIDKDNFIYFQDRVGDTFRYNTPVHHDVFFIIIIIYCVLVSVEVMSEFLLPAAGIKLILPQTFLYSRKGYWSNKGVLFVYFVSKH